MEKFKKGDKVKYIGPDVVAYEPGKIYTVLDIDEELEGYEVYSESLEDAFIVPYDFFEEAN